MYSQRGGIHLVTLEDVEAADISLPVTNVNGPVGIDIDPITKVLYWTDILKDEISSLNLDVSTSQGLVRKKTRRFTIMTMLRRSLMPLKSQGPSVGILIQ